MQTLKIAKFKTSTVDWATAIKNLYERATQLRDELYHEHKYPSHLVEVLETSIRGQPFLSSWTELDMALPLKRTSMKIFMPSKSKMFEICVP